ncbi:unnamed protein product [Danaus chrysippus]|uniref:(African queen) hypothetical protein n=1 Tax=Danaus chrysippus TaxID=151541 RepID=A0A8J2QP23_9NEOP|nr:unnamed protein product [Danaus chrysippus]
MRAVVYSAVFIFLQLSCMSAMFNIPLRCFLLDMDCAKNLIQNHMALLSEAVDPMHIDFLRVDEQGFKGDITNLTVTGNKDAILDSTDFDYNKMEIILQYHMDLSLRGLYKSSPMDPGADVSMLIKNIHVTLMMPFEIIRNGVDNKFINIKAFKYDYQIKNDIQSYISDLYRHAYRGENILNSPKNYKLIAIPFGRSFMDKILGNVFEIVRSHLLSQPLLNLFIY